MFLKTSHFEQFFIDFYSEQFFNCLTHKRFCVFCASYRKFNILILNGFKLMFA